MKWREGFCCQTFVQDGDIFMGVSLRMLERVSVCMWERKRYVLCPDVKYISYWRSQSKTFEPERHTHPQLKSCQSSCYQDVHIYWAPAINMHQFRGGSETIESKNGTLCPQGAHSWFGDGDGAVYKQYCGSHKNQSAFHIISLVWG